MIILRGMVCYMDKISRIIIFSFAVGMTEIVCTIYTNGSTGVIFAIINGLCLLIYSALKKKSLLSTISRNYPTLYFKYPSLQKQSVFFFYFILEGEEMDIKLKKDLKETLTVIFVHYFVFFSFIVIALLMNVRW